MSQAIALLLLPAGLAGVTADQFQVLVEQLCQELAPATPLENVLVAQVASYLGRLRKAAVAEPEDKVNDRDWLRYHSMAERGFWKHYNELMKGRRQKARSTPKAAPAIAPAPVAVAPTPAPAPVAPPRPAAAPQPQPRPQPAPSAADLPPRPEPRRRTDRSATTEADRQRWRAECLALMAAQEPAGNSTFLPISVAPAAPDAPKAEPVVAGS